jgi:hypothetical protein
MCETVQRQNVANAHYCNVHLLAIGKNSSFNTAINNGAAGGTNAVADANMKAGEASIGSKHRTTDMHSNVLANAVIRSELT